MSFFTVNLSVNKATFMIEGTEATKHIPSFINLPTNVSTRISSSTKIQVLTGLDQSATTNSLDMERIIKPMTTFEGGDGVALLDTSHMKKVIFIMGATGAGKTKLSIELANYVPVEIINSDKIQVYKGLDIAGNKVSHLERKGVAHHLLGEIDQEVDFDAVDFCHHALLAIEKIIKSGKIPIVVGGSNSFLEALLETPNFKSTYESCFIWVDVELPVLYSRVSKRIDEMVDAGLIDEVRGLFKPDADYNKGVRRAIGVAEFHEYFLAEANVDSQRKQVLLESAIDEMKINTQKLVNRQVGKIQRLKEKLGWPINRIDATAVFGKKGEEDANVAWNEVVMHPCIQILKQFFEKDGK